MWTSSFGNSLWGLLFLLAVPLYTSAQYFSATVYKDESGMPSNRIFDMCQTATGEMWMLTEAGLVAYDGLHWHTFHDSLDLPIHGNVRLKALPESSVILTGLDKNGLSIRYFKHGIWSEIPLPNSIGAGDIHFQYRIAISLDPSGSFRIALGTSSRLIIYDGESWSTTSFKNGLSDLVIEQLAFMGESILAATSEGLFRFHKGNLTQMHHKPGVKAMLPDLENFRIFLMGADWLGHFNTSQDSLHLYFDNQPIGLKEPAANSNLLLHQNKLYYSYNSVLTQYDLKEGTKTPIITRLFDKDHTCIRALFDHEKNLWVATLRGAFKVNNLNIYSYNGFQLLENEVTAIYEASDGRIFLGSNNGFNILDPDGHISKHVFAQKYLNPRIMDIVAYRGTIYMAANEAGIVSILPDGTLQHYHPAGSNTRVIDLHVYDDQLFALSRGQLYSYNNGKWVKSSYPRVITSGSVRKLVLDQNRAMLLSQTGVYDFDQKMTIVDDELSGNNIYNEIFYQGKTLLGTTDGIREIAGDQLTASKTYKLPASCAVYAFLEDRDGKLWAGTNQGIFHLDENGYQQMSTKHGLVGNEINRNAFRLLSNGQMAIGTDQGVSFFDPVTPKVPTPQVTISHYQVNGTNSDQNSLGYDQNNIRFHYKAVSYYDEFRIEYRFRLLGLETEWQRVPYHSQRSVLYGKLEPGSYQLEVQARIKGQEWGASAYSQTLTIAPAFWDTIWFEVLLGVVAALILYMFIRFRSKQLKLRNKLLRTKVEEKTSELHRQNQELVQAIQELKAAQGQLIQSEKLASMGHLTAGIAHELNNPLNYIRGGAECILKNLEELNGLANGLSANGQLEEYREILDESRELAHAIVSGANKSTSIVKSLSAFSADSQNFYSFIVLEKEIENALTLLNNQIGFRVTVNKMLANIPPVECYQAKINQTIVNVLLNALQAIEDKGEITIRLFRKDLHHISLEITDNGEGLNASDAEKVFEPFFTTKDNNPGLGLTIARSIVQEHKGEITFESTPNVATKVCITLPINQTFHPELEE